MEDFQIWIDLQNPVELWIRSNLQDKYACKLAQNVNPHHQNTGLKFPLCRYNLLCLVEIWDWLKNNVSPKYKIISGLRPIGSITFKIPSCCNKGKSIIYMRPKIIKTNQVFNACVIIHFITNKILDFWSLYFWEVLLSYGDLRAFPSCAGIVSLTQFFCQLHWTLNWKIQRRQDCL